MSVLTLNNAVADQAPPTVWAYYYQKHIKRVIIEGWPADKIVLTSWEDDTKGIGIRAPQRAPGEHFLFERLENGTVVCRSSLPEDSALRRIDPPGLMRISLPSTDEAVGVEII